MKTLLPGTDKRLSVDANDLLSSSQMEEIKAGDADKSTVTIQLCDEGCTVCVSCALCVGCVALVL